MKPLFVLLTAAAFGLPALGHAETVFKWVDANGVTNYTTTPPPASVHKVAAVNASPAIASTYPASAANEEAQYWRERRLRETGDNLSSSRQRQDAEDLRQAQMRQEIALRYDEDQRRAAEERRRQALFDQCLRERRVTCDGPDYGYGTVVVGARHRPRPISWAAPFPVAGSSGVINPTPGAPSIGVNVPNPPAPSRPALEPPRKK